MQQNSLEPNHMHNPRNRNKDRATTTVSETSHQCRMPTWYAFKTSCCQIPTRYFTPSPKESFNSHPRCPDFNRQSGKFSFTYIHIVSVYYLNNPHKQKTLNTSFTFIFSGNNTNTITSEYNTRCQYPSDDPYHWCIYSLHEKETSH